MQKYYKERKKENITNNFHIPSIQIPPILNIVSFVLSINCFLVLYFYHSLCHYLYINVLFFLNYLKVWCIHHGTFLLNIHSIISQDKDILMDNHSTVIKFRKFDSDTLVQPIVLIPIFPIVREDFWFCLVPQGRRKIKRCTYEKNDFGLSNVKIDLEIRIIYQ